MPELITTIKFVPRTTESMLMACLVRCCCRSAPRHAIFRRNATSVATLDEARRALALGHIVDADGVRVETREGVEHFVLNVANGGLAWDIGDSLDDDTKGAWGPLAYARGALDVIGHPTVHTVRVQVDDELPREERVLTVAVSSGRTCGGGLILAPTGDPQDGLLEVTLLLEAPPGAVAALAARVDALKVAVGTEAGAQIGPMINGAAIEKISAHVEDALEKGATRATAARDLPAQFADPVVLTGATLEMRLASEETFGPVAPIFRFDTEDEALRIANGTPFGLAAYFYTTDMARAFRFGEALEAGLDARSGATQLSASSPVQQIKQDVSVECKSRI